VTAAAAFRSSLLVVLLLMPLLGAACARPEADDAEVEPSPSGEETQGAITPVSDPVPSTPTSTHTPQPAPDATPTHSTLQLPTPTPPAPSSSVTLEGIFAAAIGDPPPGSAQQARVAATVTDSTGKIWRLEFSEEVATPPGGWLRLNLRQVRVEGTLTGQPDTILVSSIVTVD
jgi:hypothetical protein